MLRFLPLTSRTHDPPPRVRSARNARRQRGGFTLNEVLISMGILAVGITSVASLFPAAMILQKEAVQETMRHSNARSAESVLRAKTIRAENLFAITDNISLFPTMNDDNGSPREDTEKIDDIEFDVYALAEFDYDYTPGLNGAAQPPESFDTDMRPAENAAQGGFGSTGGNQRVSYAQTNSYLGFWPPEDRAFPTYIPRVANRETFVVPLIRRGPEATQYINDWVTYAMVAQGRPELQTHYPNRYLTGLDGMPAETICANPFDHAWTGDAEPNHNLGPDRFPKMFRVPVELGSDDLFRPRNGGLRWVGIAPGGGTYTTGPVLAVRPGDMVLANTGNIYRIGRVNYTNAGVPQGFTLNLEGRQAVDDIASPSAGVADIDAVWICPPGYVGDGDGLGREPASESPLQDIRILNRNVVRIGGYE